MTNLANRLAVRNIGPGRFALGKVTLDKEDRTVRFPAVFNQERGGVEFLIVTPYGRTHESVLRTEVEPFQIHIAMLLLDAQGSTNAAQGSPPRAPGNPTQSAFGSAIAGDPVAIEVQWKGPEGREIRRRAEDLVLNIRAGRPMEAGDWTYSGSFVYDGVFRAQLEGTVASVIREPGAIINNPRPDAANDDIWGVNTNTIPAMDTPAEVILRLRK